MTGLESNCGRLIASVASSCRQSCSFLVRSVIKVSERRICTCEVGLGDRRFVGYIDDLLLLREREQLFLEIPPTAT